jgi:phospholipid/cholesterol/gamma-HCH transport system substrate-binding protein
MNYPPLLFHPINSITAYKGQIMYDTPQTEAKAETPVPYLQWQNAPGVTPPQVPPDADLTSLMVPPAAPQGAPGQPAPTGPAPGPVVADGAAPTGPAPGPVAPDAPPQAAPPPGGAGG